MEFDHRPGETKMPGIKGVGQMVQRRAYKWEEVLAEVAKCDLVCANCHRIRTQSREDYLMKETNA